MISSRRLLPFACVALLAGCAIQQTVRPVAKLDAREVCIVTNPNVRSGFIEEVRSSLAAKGYGVRMLPPSSAIDACPVTATYMANWRWDLALYMAYAEIRVFEHGESAGEAVYDSRSGGANFSKFIDAETKIRELVHQLFPGGASS